MIHTVILPEGLQDQHRPGWLISFAFLSFPPFSPGTRASNWNILKEWGISIRPCLHRPCSKLPRLSRVEANWSKMFHFGPFGRKRPVWVHFGLPTVLGPLLSCNCCWERADEPQSLSGPSGLESRKSQKRVFPGLPALAAIKSEKRQKRLKTGLFWLIFDSFWLFSDFLAVRGPEGGMGRFWVFSYFFVTLGPKVPKGSVARPRVLKTVVSGGDVNHYISFKFSAYTLWTNLSSRFWIYLSSGLGLGSLTAHLSPKFALKCPFKLRFSPEIEKGSLNKLKIWSLKNLIETPIL